MKSTSTLAFQYCQRMNALISGGVHTVTLALIKILTSWICQSFKRSLCAPPSSVKSERLFSTTGNIFEAKRNRLLPEHGEQIAFLNYNMPTFIE